MKTQERIYHLRKILNDKISKDKKSIEETEKELNHLTEIENVIDKLQDRISELENNLEEKRFNIIYLEEKTFITPLGEIRIYAENMELKTRIEKFIENSIIKQLNFELKPLLWYER